MDFAHRHNVIHRDVKPANIVLTASDDGDDEHVYLTDFGLAKSMAWNPVKPEQLAITSGTSKNPPADLRIADLKGNEMRKLAADLQVIDDLSFSPNGMLVAYWDRRPPARAAASRISRTCPARRR